MFNRLQRSVCSQKGTAEYFELDVRYLLCETLLHFFRAGHANRQEKSGIREATPVYTVALYLKNTFRRSNYVQKATSTFEINRTEGDSRVRLLKILECLLW